MRIAFISYEAPPDTLIGGIGTYIGQAARLLARRGHDVEVFAGSPHRAVTLQMDGYRANLIEAQRDDRAEFVERIGRVFAARHAEVPFDVLEGPEFMAEASAAKRLVPEIPLVLKLHMSMALIERINRPPRTFVQCGKDAVKALLQPMLRLKRWEEKDWSELERPHVLQADEIVAPCRDIAEIEAAMWGLDRSRISIVPLPFVPTPDLIDVPVETDTQTVGYIGRLEQRKGVIDLAKAVPLVLPCFPKAKFLFAGSTLGSPVPKMEMREYLEQLLAPWKANVTFTGHVPHDNITDVFRRIDIAVLPSLWENFPIACLEAMSAARGVIGSSAGGMAEQLDGGNAGILVPPRKPKQIAAAICELLENPSRRKELGRKARARVLATYNAERVGEMMEQSYHRAIERARSRTQATVAA